MMSEEGTAEQPVLAVEVDPGVVAIFAEFMPEDLEIVQAALMPATASGALASTVSAAAAGGNVIAQAVAARATFQGLVKMAPESMQAMKTAAPLVKDGWNLGVLTQGKGISHVVRFKSATGAQVVGSAAAVGPAIAMLGIQMQLAEVAALTRENLALTDEVLRTIRTERWAEVHGLHETMLRAIDEARAVGVVSAPIWQNVAGQEATLSKVRREFRDKTASHVAALEGKKDPKERRAYLRHHGEALLQDAQSLILAQNAWFTYQAIRAGHLHSLIDTDQSAGLLLEKVITDAREAHAQDLAMARRLLVELNRQAQMMSESSSRRSLTIGKAAASKDVTQISQILLAQLERLGQAIQMEAPPIPVPTFAAFEKEQPEDVPRVLRWQLERGERLLALTEAKADGWLTGWPLGDKCFVAVTDRRVLVGDRDDLVSKGEVATQLPLDSIRYVRFAASDADSGKGRARLDILTSGSDVRLTFGRWANEEPHRAQVELIAQLLKSEMRLPSDEVPASPIAPRPDSTLIEAVESEDEPTVGSSDSDR